MRESHSNHRTTATIQVLVDSQKPGKGQSMDSGGIRDDKTGRMISQYKNPRVYKESPKPTGRQIPTQEEIWQKEWKCLRHDVGLRLVDAACDKATEDIIVPLMHKGFQKICEFFVSLIEDNGSPQSQKKSDKKEQVKDVSEDHYDNEKIIRFPNKRVG